MFSLFPLKFHQFISADTDLNLWRSVHFTVMKCCNLSLVPIFPTRFLSSLTPNDFQRFPECRSSTYPDKGCELVASGVIWTGGEDANNIQFMGKWSLNVLKCKLFLAVWWTSWTHRSSWYFLHCLFNIMYMHKVKNCKWLRHVLRGWT